MSEHTKPTDNSGHSNLSNLNARGNQSSQSTQSSQSSQSLRSNQGTQNPDINPTPVIPVPGDYVPTAAALQPEEANAGARVFSERVFLVSVSGIGGFGIGRRQRLMLLLRLLFSAFI
ncbi:hypothetical protein RQN30_08330 [Arcanobacterium hippocoleae]